MNRIHWPLRLLVATAILLTSCGGGGDGTQGGGGTSPPTLAHFAGNLGGPGPNDGVGQAARFNGPVAIASDSAGNLYVADGGNHTIRKITPTGFVSTFAGKAGVVGNADGTGPAASFRFPMGVATDGAGNVYVADSGNNTIRKITTAGVVSTFAGTAGEFGSTDGTGPAARFSLPYGIAIDSTGNLFVTDIGNDTIRMITPAGVVSTFAGTANAPGSTNGIGGAASISGASAVAIDSADNLYVFAGQVRKITPAGIVSTLAGGPFPGSADGTGDAASFRYPQGIATDSAGNVYVADTDNSAIRKITPEGVVTTFAGAAENTGSADGVGGEASFAFPVGIATDGAGNAYVADTRNNTIRKISPEGLVGTLAGAAEAFGSTDGVGRTATFGPAIGISPDRTGNLYVTDQFNNTIRRIAPSGMVSTFAGTGPAQGSSDGTGSAASFNSPKGITTDTYGNVYVADSGNGTIRKISPSGDVTTFAGTAGQFGTADGAGSAARFMFVSGIAMDDAGNVFVADSNAIRKITAAGVVSTLAGSAGAMSGNSDGIGPAASFWLPQGVATDASGNVYVADTGNHTVRKVTPSGRVTTLAGTAGEIGSVDGTGPAARFNSPSGIATDPAGNVYVADTGNHTIRKISPEGAVSTLVGVAGVQGFLAGPLPAALKTPVAVAINDGSLYIGLSGGVAVVRSLN